MKRRTTTDSQTIQRALQAAAAHAQDMSINHRRGHVLMSEQFLDRPDVGSPLEGVRGKAVPESGPE